MLDGQQRLQSLFIGLMGSYAGRELFLDILSGEVAAPDDIKYKFAFLDSASAKFPWIKFKDLADALDEYYETADDPLHIEIQRGRGYGYEPKISWAEHATGGTPQGRTGKHVACYHVGNNREALEYLIERYRSSPSDSPRLVAFRDTHVRPKLPTRHPGGQYKGIQAAFSEFLRRADADTNVATMILGGEMDKEYIRAMQTAARGHGDKLKCFRLRNPGPILNFILLDYDDSTSEVLFGWARANRAGRATCSGPKTSAWLKNSRFSMTFCRPRQTPCLRTPFWNQLLATHRPGSP